MKYLISLILVLLLYFQGCDLVTGPESPPEKVLNKQIIKLPPRSGLSVENTFSVTETIDGDKGGEIRLHEQYIAVTGQTVKIDAKLKIKKHAFQGVVDITLTADDGLAAVSFTPPMVFDRPAELDLKFEGIDLSQLNLPTGNYDFVFIADDGSIEVVEYNALHVDEEHSKIWVTHADLNHFSRYGFVN